MAPRPHKRKIQIVKTKYRFISLPPCKLFIVSDEHAQNSGSNPHHRKKRFPIFIFGTNEREYEEEERWVKQLSTKQKATYNKIGLHARAAQKNYQAGNRTPILVLHLCFR